MKNSSFLIGLLSFMMLSASAHAQVLSTTKGEITFFSNAPLEDISAKNSRVISMINQGSKELVVRVPVNQFEFPNKLMQQHFNENYLESERYPYATFKGKITDEIDFSKPGTYDATAVGVLSIHGVEQKRTLKGKMAIASDGSVQLTTGFSVALADHKIDIPKLVFKKIAEVVDVKATFGYQAFKK